MSQCMLALAAGDLPADRTHILSTGGMVSHVRGCHAAADLGCEVRVPAEVAERARAAIERMVATV